MGSRLTRAKPHSIPRSTLQTLSMSLAGTGSPRRVSAGNRCGETGFRKITLMPGQNRQGNQSKGRVVVAKGQMHRGCTCSLCTIPRDVLRVAKNLEERGTQIPK